MTNDTDTIRTPLRVYTWEEIVAMWLCEPDLGPEPKVHPDRATFPAEDLYDHS